MENTPKSNFAVKVVMLNAIGLKVDQIFKVGELINFLVFTV